MSIRDTLLRNLRGYTPCGSDGHADAAEQMLDTYRAEVRREVLTEVAAIAERFTERWPDMDAMKTAGIIGPFSVLGALADELRQVAAGKDIGGGSQSPADESTQPTQAEDFFQPGRTYADGDGFTAPEALTLFRVETVARHPSRGTLRAIGWAKIGAAPGGIWHGYFLDEGEFEGWTEITEVEQPTAPADRFPYLGGTGEAL